MNKQKDYIKRLKEISISPLFGAINYFNNKQKKWVPGKREDLNKREYWDHITVASNAVHYELDARSYAANYKIAKKIISVLDSRGWDYNIFISSRKGIHIETYFNKPEFKNQEQRDLFTNAMSYGLSFKHIRFWLWNLILDEAAISKELRGNGKIIDSNCINFDDLQDKDRLLRVCGGCKKYYNKVTDEEEIYYKTYVNNADFKDKSIKVKVLDDVKYPVKTSLFTFNIYEFCEFLENYVENAKNSDIEQLKKIDLTQEGGYINLETVKLIREGLGRGQRSIGAQILAIAMSNDELDLKTQKTIMKDYVSKCSQVGEPFTTEEANQWIYWVQSQEHVFWNCGLAEQAGLHDASLCDYCKKKHKEAYDFLYNKKILQEIKDVLDKEIMGEDETKMLMFLLVLSKDFPSRTGLPGWNINSDSMSQNIILSSDSSSGKTYMTKKILQLFGEKNKDYYVMSRITKNVLNYMVDINMDKKIIFIEEIQGLDEATNQLRLWMSEGELTLKTVEKIKNEEGIEVNMSTDKSTVGQPVFITNQAEGVIEEQLNNRSWVLGMDTTTNQTSKILTYQDTLNIGYDKINEIEIRKIRDAMKQLKQYHFIIPYADWKAMNIPINDVRSRRDYQKFLTLIKCSAYLHQKQRYIVKDEKDREYIICSFEDYNIAKEYSHNILGATFSGLSINQIDLLNHIRKSNWSEEFMISDLMRNLGKSQSHWYGQLSQLVDLGFLTCDKNMGKSNIYSLNKNRVETVVNLPSDLLLKRATYYQVLRFFEKNKFTIIQDCEDSENSVIANDFRNRCENLYNLDKIEIEAILRKKGEKIAPIKKLKNGKDVFLPKKDKKLKANSHRNNRCDFPEISRKTMIEYFKKTNQHCVLENQIINHFGKENEEHIKELLKALLVDATLMKYQGGYILL